MTRTHFALLIGAAAVTLGSGPCGPVLQQAGPISERRHATISPRQFGTLGTIAGGGGMNYDKQITATVRQQLTDSGVKAVPVPGRFENEQAALQISCQPQATPKVDGLLFVWYNRLELHDCVSGEVAYEVSGEQQGIIALTNRLVAYLKERN